jgi:CIC family chloride channel protein
MIDLTAASLIPLLLASVSAALTSRFFLGNDVLFHFDLSEAFLGKDVPFYILLGLVCGIVSIYFSSVYFSISNALERIKHKYLRALVGGVMLGILVFAFPPLYGEGYGVINALVENDGARVIDQIRFVTIDHTFWMITFSLAAIMLLKVVATTITLKSGGIGGIFAPTLFMGSTLGFVFSRVFNGLGISSLSVTNFTLVSMAGLMAGVLHAPLTAMFLIAEITGGYELFIPLMITTAISFITVKYAVPHSVYNRQLARRGELITHHKDQAVLTLMELKNEIEVNFKTVGPYDTLGDLVKEVSKSSRNLFPVIDQDQRFLGVVTLDDIRDIMFDHSKYESIVVHELMQAAPEFIYTTDSMEMVMKKFESSGAWNLPVLRGEQYVGFVSKSKLFSAYRQLLRDFYEVEE